MKRIIALLIAILALIAGAGRMKVAVTSDCTPVSAEIAKEQVSLVETPAEAAVSPVLPYEDDLAIDIDPFETEPETASNEPLQEPTTEAETESNEMPTEEKETLDIFPSADSPDVKLAIEAVPGDSGDRMTAETDIEKSAEPAVIKPEKIPEATSEPVLAVVSDNAPDPVIIPIEPTTDTFPADENYSEQQGSTNTSVFVNPCRGGPNPFDDETPTEIDDHNSQEFVGDGDRPGEGILF